MDSIEAPRLGAEAVGRAFVDLLTDPGRIGRTEAFPKQNLDCALVTGVCVSVQ
jgi:hypothetical protein